GGRGRVASPASVAGALAVLTGVMLAGVGGGGCSDDGATAYPDGGAASDGLGVGGACTASSDCRPGLDCNAGSCQPCACSPSGATCVINDECAAGMYCGTAKTCAPGGTGASGATCASDADCAAGLRCDLVGLSAQCLPEGTGDVGASCGSSADCYGGLVCTGGLCQALPPGSPPFGTPTWAGETCVDLTGPTQAYFRVPRGSNDGDFYRLPFPNDVRNDGGHITLTGHPTPGPALLGYDLVARYLDDIEATENGFSTYPTVYFRFSAPVDINGTLKGPGAVRWLDITTPTSPVELSLGWVATTARNAYICDNWMGIRPPRGAPLTPGHTYAVVLATSILDANGQTIQVSSDLTALLGDTAPTDTTLAPQWTKYAPLRAWAKALDLPVSSILDATVFTTGAPAAIGPNLAAAVAATAVPTATSWIDCANAPSPCPQATGDRACGSPQDPTFAELHAMITLPIFQQGSEPYLTPTDGGDFVLSSNGVPQMQRTEAVCMSLTVPTGTAMPASGWPLLVYAHGTGGSFRSDIPEGVAARMAAIGVAVLGIDQVEHGTRRGTSQDSPDNLFFNFANPAAARGNPLQGAADQMSLVRFATGFDLPAASSPTQAEIKAGALAFWGHSQGATCGGIAMPYTSGVTGAVLSGQGASLMDALVTKTNPVDIAAIIPVVLEDPSVDINHPVLSLLQGDLGLVDPLNYAGLLVTNPLAAADQKHLFQPYGQGDTYAPPATQQTFAITAGLGQAAAPTGVTPDAFLVSATVPVPAGGNATVNGVDLTALVRQYAPASTYDGHFVAYDNATAEADVDGFIEACVAGQIPMIGQ
ncbi:MAG: dickkopf-related protein, partial [Polyangiaceae bacterium]